MNATALDLAAVPAGYRHHRRLVTPGVPLRLGRTDLKWYEIRRPHAPMPGGLEDETRAFLAREVAEGRLAIAGQPGFVMLHLADAGGGPNSVALLLVSTWNQANELWESVYWKPVVGGSYERVEKRDHAATYCVWELAAVWHERGAWDRFLASTRDEAALRAYLDDSFSGIA
ncbi:MAG TPA: hypothetical protein VFQ51_16045 [Vicinamibacteria bacterium]|nr:hypothetical protein [Vicinamibacteria bacterium]